MKRKMLLSLGMVLTASVVFLFTFFETARAGDDGDRNLIVSEDEKFAAEPVGSFPNIHYQVTEVASGKILFQTQSKDHGMNDVKTGCFSPDSRLFAAVYMFGGGEGLTWVGIWDTRTGKMVQEKSRNGYVRDPSWIFSE